SSRKEAEEERKKAYRRHHPKAVIIEEIDNFIASFNQIAGIKDNFEISETLLRLRDRGLIIRADDEITPQFILLNREITPTLADALVTIQVIAADINTRDLNLRGDETAPYHASLNPATEPFEIDALTKTKFIFYSREIFTSRDLSEGKRTKFTALNDFLDPEFRGAASATGEEGTFLLNPLYVRKVRAKSPIAAYVESEGVIEPNSIQEECYDNLRAIDENLPESSLDTYGLARARTDNISTKDYANAENTGLFTTFDGITVNPILTDKNDTHTVRNEDELRTGFNRQVDHINGNYTRLAGDLSEVRKAIDFLNSFAESAPNTPRSRVWEGNTDSQNLLQDLRAREIVLVERAARERENARRPLPSWTWKLGGDSTDPVAIFNEYGEEVAYPIETLDKAALDEAHSIRSVITNPTNFSDLVNGTIFTAPNKDSRVGEITADVAGRDTFNRNFTYTSFGIETVGVKPYNHDKNQLDNVHEIIKDINAKTVVNMDDLNEEAGKEIFDRIEAITAVDNAKLPNIRKKEGRITNFVLDPKTFTYTSHGVSTNNVDPRTQKKADLDFIHVFRSFGANGVSNEDILAYKKTSLNGNYQITGTEARQAYDLG
ncbi:5387_t:CDS:10, partial [Entrophospora sp. SA101]